MKGNLSYLDIGHCLGSTYIIKKDWKTVLKHVGYKGDYKFNTSKSLNLKQKKMSKILITGATKGLGRELALWFAKKFQIDIGWQKKKKDLKQLIKKLHNKKSQLTLPRSSKTRSNKPN